MFSGEGEGKYIVESNDIGWVSDSLDYNGLKSNILVAASSPNLLKQKSYNCKVCAKEMDNRPKQIKALYDYFESKK